MIDKMTLNQELSDYIRLMRLKYRKSQEDMGELLKVSRNTYSKWEREPIKLSLETLMDIARVVNEDIFIFFQDNVAKRNEWRK